MARHYKKHHTSSKKKNYRRKSNYSKSRKFGSCNYHLCDKKHVELFKCKYCDEYFCKEHLIAKKPQAAPFKSKDIERQIEWEKKGGHPCIPYSIYAKDKTNMPRPIRLIDSRREKTENIRIDIPEPEEEKIPESDVSEPEEIIDEPAKIDIKVECFDCGKDLLHNKKEYFYDENIGERITLCPECWARRREGKKKKPKGRPKYKKRRKYTLWQTIKYKLRRATIPIWFLIVLILMIVIAVIHQFYIIKIFSYDISIIYYICEIIVIGYLMFRLLKKFDGIHVGSDLRLFGLRMLSGLISFIGILIFFFMWMAPFFALFDENWAAAILFGSSFHLPLTGTILYGTIGIGMTIIGAYLYFKFQRRTGEFVWFGRIR